MNTHLTELQKRDVVNWHPFTNAGSAPPIPIVRAHGTLLFDDQGKSYIDAISSWWVNLHGHSHPHIVNAVHKALEKWDHVMFAGFTHSPAIDFSEKLLPKLPGAMKKLFFSDNGSTAIEVALKISLQYFYNIGAPRKKIIAFRNSYHGDTFGAMSVAERGLFTRPFFSHLFEVDFINVLRQGDSSEQKNALLTEFKNLVSDGSAAAFIYEPVVQGAAGMHMYPPDFLDRLLRIAEEFSVIKIADEVMTGFGRTGPMFAHEFTDAKPDIVVLSKGITGGVFPLGATAVSGKIFDAFDSTEKDKTFYHGHSYTANPVILSAALASLELTEKPEFRENIARIELSHKRFAEQLRNHPQTENVRMQGTILALDVKSGSQTSYLNPLRDSLYNFFISRGVLLRPLGNTVYILPPYSISNLELEKVYAVIMEALDDMVLQRK